MYYYIMLPPKNLMWNVHLPGILRNIKVFRCLMKDWILKRTRMREEGTTAKSMNEAKK